MSTKEELAPQIDAAQWEWIRPHNERGALVIVDRELDLAEVGERLAADDAVTVQRWMASKLLGKPSAEQVAGWEQTPARSFRTLIVSPFVLMQEC